MKRLAVVLAALSCATSAYAEDVWVQVKESKVRAQPKFYAPTVADVRYGDRVERLSDTKGWMQVRTSKKKEGYLPLSAVTRQQVVLSGRSVSKIQADTADVVLAGKGFSKEVEEQYKQRDSSARFDLVDRVERGPKASPAEMTQFVKTGGLRD